MSDHRDCALSAHTLQNKNSFYTEKFFRILEDDFPEEKYTPKARDQDRTTYHFGQRKLFLAELEFLVNVCTEIPQRLLKKKIVILYVGAAPGLHINYLSKLFPFIELVLYDPGIFEAEATEKIKINMEYFTDETAVKFKDEYADYLRLFISDIRRFGPGTKLTDEEVESEILEDMNHQMNWYKLLDPFRSLLKFRLPYVENRNNAKTKIEYLNGEIYFQIWPPCSSSETRLYVRKNAALKSYDCVKYENQMFRFNNFERTLCYYHEYKLPGLDHCYDCRAEIHVFEQYLERFQKISILNKKNEKLIKFTIEEYVQHLNEHIKANEEFLKMVYDKKEYQVRFTDFGYGKQAEEVFNHLNMGKKISINKTLKRCLKKKKIGFLRKKKSKLSKVKSKQL